jgi:hypothetical protein
MMPFFFFFFFFCQGDPPLTLSLCPSSFLSVFDPEWREDGSKGFQVNW